MSVPVISVVMPVFNASAHLKESIDSILNQTFKDFDIIIIDDGSTDNSVEIIQKYDDKRIHLFRNVKNEGLLYSLNKGIEMAPGRYIARMDADDISLPDRFEKQYKYLSNHPECSLVCSWINIIDEKGIFICTQDRYNMGMYYDLTFKCVIAHPTIMCTRESLEQIGKYQIPFAEDYDLWSRYIEVFKIFKLDEPLVNYRQSSSSISQVALKQEYLEATKKNVTRNIGNLLGTNKIDDSIVECYMDNLEPILKLDKIKLYVSCITLLKKINRAIILKENPNRDIKNIKEASDIKKELIFNSLISQLSFSKSILLFLLTSECHLGYKLIKQKIRTIYFI